MKVFMNKISYVFLLLFFASFSVNSASVIGQCVYPQVVQEKGKGIKFKRPVAIYKSPSLESESFVLQSLDLFSVRAEAKGGFIQLVATPGFDKPNPDAGKIVGWAKRADFDFQDLRNCN
jgi:hypothetical protein